MNIWITINNYLGIPWSEWKHFPTAHWIFKKKLKKNQILIFSSKNNFPKSIKLFIQEVSLLSSLNILGVHLWVITCKQPFFLPCSETKRKNGYSEVWQKPREGTKNAKLQRIQTCLPHPLCTGVVPNSIFGAVAGKNHAENGGLAIKNADFAPASGPKSFPEGSSSKPQTNSPPAPLGGVAGLENRGWLGKFGLAG